MRKLFFILVIAALFFGYYSIKPSLDRDWALDQIVLPTAEFNEDNTVTISNVRNFIYASTTDYVVQYYDTEVDLNKLESVDYIVEPFGSIGAAHTFLSFGFSDGQQIAVSIEIRKEKGESFSPLKGLLKRYELMYVVADERDVVNLRANYRHDDVYIYPTTATKEQATTLFRSVFERVNSLSTTPEFYNTLTSNCTTNIVKHINAISDRDISWDHRLLFPEDSDILAKELGLIAPDISIEEARIKYKINERAAVFQNDEEFSKRIREPYVSEAIDTSGEYKVVRVIDGDTIDVEIDGQVRRVRYIGMNTPEVGDTASQNECLADEASNRNKKLVEGKFVKLEKDVSEVDKYGRLLRYVYVGDELVNLTLVKEGYADNFTLPPDVKQESMFRSAKQAAKSAGIGLWGAACSN